MRLCKFEIKNFKGIEYATFDWDDLIVLIGENNVGKSCVLQALEWFLGGSQIRDSALFRNNESDEDHAIELTGHFDGLSDQEQQAHAVRGRMIEDQWIIRKTFWFDKDGAESARGGPWKELYYSFSTDAGETWSTNIPVSPVFDSRIGIPNGQNKIGDYYHMISDNLGVNVAYAATFNGEQDIYFLRIGPWDCNANEIPDSNDIAAGSSLDCNNNDVPDECEYRGDFDGDQLTTLRDLAMYQQCFTGDGQSITDPCCHLLDLDKDNRVTLTDLPALHRVLSGP